MREAISWHSEALKRRQAPCRAIASRHSDCVRVIGGKRWCHEGHGRILCCDRRRRARSRRRRRLGRRDGGKDSAARGELGPLWQRRRTKDGVALQARRRRVLRFESDHLLQIGQPPTRLQWHRFPHLGFEAHPELIEALPACRRAHHRMSFIAIHCEAHRECGRTHHRMPSTQSHSVAASHTPPHSAALSRTPPHSAALRTCGSAPGTPSP